MGSSKKGMLNVLIAAVLWGSSGVCAQFIMQESQMSSPFLTMTRLLFAGLILLMLGFVHGDRIFRVLQNRRDALSLLFFSLFGALTVQFTFLMTIEKSNAATATVHIEPLGIYSHKHKDFSSLPENATVAVPNNTTNLSRALFLLQAQKLIKLDPKFTDPATTLATPKDVVENPKHLKILEIESPQIPRSLDDVDLAVINGNYALEAGLVPAKDALGLESAEHNPYANILVTTPALANDPRIKALAKDLTSPQVAEFIRKTYNGSVIPVAPQS